MPKRTRRAAMEALRKSEASFRTLIEHAPDAIGVIQDEKFVYMNSACARLLGFERPDEVIGRTVSEFVDGRDQEVLLSRLRMHLEGIPLPPVEYRVRRRDGQMVEAETLPVPTIFDGRPALASIARNVSAGKDARARAMQLDRRLSLEHFAAGVAHEINNPLGYMMVNLDVLLGSKLPALGALATALETEVRGSVSPELGDMLSECDQMLRLLRDGVVRVGEIVRNLRTVSHAGDKSEPPRSIVDVRHILNAAIAVARHEFERRATVDVTFEDVAPISANEAELGQVFLNVLLNAAQAIPEGDPARNRVSVSVEPAEKYVRVRVRDTGAGIPNDVLSRVFDPFFTTRPGLGTGLGLWISQGIVRALRGEIHIESVPGSGTTVEIVLPAAVPETT